MNTIEVIGYAASAFTLAAVCMKTMIPLRTFAICGNILLIVYAVYLNLTPMLIMQSILLPLNGYRLYEMTKLVKDVKASVSGDLSADWLLPFMSGTSGAKGQVLFHKGAEADYLYYLKLGRVYVPESDLYIEAGNLFGEIGVFSPDRARSSTVVCAEDCEFLKITAEKVYELYHQNPRFGFYLIKLLTQRLTQNIARLEKGAHPV
jgi:hypothetical protein